MIRALLLAVVLLVTSSQPGVQVAAAATPPSSRERCEALAGGQFQKLAGAPTQIVTARLRPASGTAPETCLVEGYVSPAVNFAILLPVSNWNGRYMVRGCGGSCGAVVVDLACVSHVRDGFACLHSDMGHRSTMTDNNWVEGNLQGLVDFGYRATHVSTLAGRALIKAFYGEDPRFSYFFACSTGGRQGLIEAQRFPDDFDGIVAIAPASMAPFGNKKPATISDINAFNRGPQGQPILPNRKTLLLHRAAMAQCDQRDGLADRLIADPPSCPFKPAQLLCRPGEPSDDCLSAAQVVVADKLYGWRAAMPGSELNWIGNFIPNAPLPGEAWAPVFDLGEGRGDPATIETLNAPNNPDLRPFRDRGGKLILVHGWDDFSVMPRPTLDYYQTMTRTMGGDAPTRAFARLFMVPGMDHCAGGAGASAIDYVGALTRWVESGQAPDALRGVHPLPGAPLDYFAVDLPLLDGKWIGFERDHQAWPGRSVPIKGRAAILPQPPQLPLLEALTASARNAEQVGKAAGYPRRSVLNQTLKALWLVLYRTDRPLAEQRAALATLAVAERSPIAHEAVLRLQAELLLE